VISGPSRDPAAPAEADPRPEQIRRPSLRLNALAGTFSNLVYFGAVFVVTPVAIRHLGTEQWGVWQLVGASAIYAQLLNLSLGTATHYQVAYRTASGDHDGLATVFTNVRLYLLAAAVLLLALLAAFGRPFVSSLVSPPLVELAWTCFAIAIGLTAVDLQTRLAPSVLIGLQRNDLYGMFQILGAAVLFSGVVLGFRSGMGLPGFVTLMTIGSMPAAICSWITYRRLLPREALRWRQPDWTLFRQMVFYSLSTILYAAGAVALYQTMKFTANWRCGGPEAAGEMGLAISLAQTISVVFTPAVGVLHSRVGQYQGEGRLAEVPGLLERALSSLGLALVPAVVFLVVAAPAIFAAWVGGSLAPEALERLASTTRLLFIGHAFYVGALPFYYVLLGVGEHRVFGIGMLAIAALNTVIGWLATAVSPRIETLGAVYGVLMLALAVGITGPAGLRRFPLPVGRMLVRAVLVPLLAAGPGALVVWLRPRVGQPFVDLALDVALFALFSLPGLEVARRRLGLELGLRLRD
jgi:O-antigen/teichoic acid export membrane protein